MAAEAPFTENIEKVVYASNLAFEPALASNGIKAFVDNYGHGSHSWACWQRDLATLMPMLAADFSRP